MALYRWMLEDRIWARSHSPETFLACLIALSLSPLLPRRLLSSSAADYPALDSLLCSSPWTLSYFSSGGCDAFGSYLDMFTISSCARLRGGMLLSGVKPCTSAPRMRVTQRNVSDVATRDAASPWRMRVRSISGLHLILPPPPSLSSSPFARASSRSYSFCGLLY
ncbi:hypothetical protein B0H14DRAFT_2815515 [Mycena olivaceomarginata]|nr:hypothetical protein B0H14DRAFT_2815515 [Mycena olivaceomarginata]